MYSAMYIQRFQVTDWKKLNTQKEHNTVAILYRGRSSFGRVRAVACILYTHRAVVKNNENSPTLKNWQFFAGTSGLYFFIYTAAFQNELIFTNSPFYGTSKSLEVSRERRRKKKEKNFNEKPRI